MDDNDHSACVTVWVARVLHGLPPARMVQAFEEAFGAMWQRAHATLGDITLIAIVDRVLYDAAERFPALAGITVGSNGLECSELRGRVETLRQEKLASAIQFVLVEFLRVLGNLTAEILTPALHAELSKLVPQDTEAASEQRPVSRLQEQEREGGKESVS